MRETLGEMMNRLAENPVVAKRTPQYVGHPLVAMREIARRIDAEAASIFRAEHRGPGVGPEDSEC
jgi:hypothetical protein